MKQRSTIKFRMFTLTMMVMFSMSALGFAGYYTFTLVQQRMAVSDLMEHQTTSLLSILRNITEIVLIPDNPQTVKNVRNEVEQFSKNIEALVAQAHDDHLSSVINSKIRSEWEVVRKDVLGFLKISRPNPDDVDTMIIFGKLSANTDKLLKQMNVFKREMEQRNASYMYSVTIIMGAIAGVLIVATIFMLTSMFRSITRPLEEISNSAKLISDGNLTVQLSVRGKDEIGILADSFRGMVNNLRSMIQHTAVISDDVKSASVHIADSAGQVISEVRVQNRAIEKTAESMEDVDNSVAQIQENSRQLFDSATSTSSAATELAVSISQVAGNAGSLDKNAQRAVEDLENMVISGISIASSVEKLSLFAEETCQSIEQIGSTIKSVQETASRSVILAEQVSKSSSEQGMTAIQDAMAGIENISHSVSALSEVVNRLGSKSLQIGKIITVIEDIASQTGLLALNAAILAAQAGQHGRSFAVVASEIRSLSNRTFLSTKEIVDVVTSVQTESSASVKMAQAGMDAVMQGVTLIEKVRDALESIYTNSLASTEMSHAIHNETSDDVLVVHRVNESIVTLREQIEEISRSVSIQNHTTGDMNIRMDEIQKIAWEIATATREQSETSRQISVIANNLLQQSEGINESVAIQKQKSCAVVTATRSIREASDHLNELANSMEHAAETLRSKAGTLSTSINRFEV